MNFKSFPYAILAGLALLSAAAHAIVLSTFNTAADLSKWGFSVGSDSVGGTGSLTWGNANGNGYAQLNYDFTPPDNPLAVFNPKYVQAKFNLPVDSTANAVMISFAVHAAQARVRVVDSTGQTFQHSVIPAGALESPDPNLLLPITLKFGATNSYWGGAADGVFHPPAKSVTVLAEATGRRGTGWVRFDQAELIQVTPTPVVFSSLTGNYVTSPVTYGPLTDHIGVSIHFYSDDRALDIIKAAGFRWIRADLKWDQAEQTKGVYSFTFFQNLVTAARNRGLKTLAILAYGNPLYTGGTMNPPVTSAALQAFSDYAAAAVTALQGTGTVFEIWNEPDLATFWPPAPSGAQFGALLKVADTRIKSLASPPQLVTGGLSAPGNAARSFLSDAGPSGGLATATGLGMHLYTQTAPETRWDDLLELAGNASSAMPGGRVWCTEWGYSSTSLDSAANGHSAASRLKQAVYTVRLILAGWMANLPVVNVYDLRDDGTDATNKEHNYGLIDRNYADKPAMTAVRLLTSLASTRTFGGSVSPSVMPSGMHAGRLIGSDDVWIIWLDDRCTDGSVSVVLPSGYLQVTDVLGAAAPVASTSSGPTVTISVAGGPIYLRVPTAALPPSNAQVKITIPSS
jgi:hypothetical protein